MFGRSTSGKRRQKLDRVTRNHAYVSGFASADGCLADEDRARADHIVKSVMVSVSATDLGKQLCEGAGRHSLLGDARSSTSGCPVAHCDAVLISWELFRHMSYS